MYMYINPFFLQIGERKHVCFQTAGNLNVQSKFRCNVLNWEMVLCTIRYNLYLNHRNNIGSLFQDARSEAEEQIYKQINDKIDNFMEDCKTFKGITDKIYIFERLPVRT